MANQHPQSEILYRDSKYELTDMKNGNSESPIQLFVLYQPKLLINRLQQLVTSSALCDLAISNGQTVYKLHCAVLTAQSPKYCELYVESASIDQPKEITVNAITKEVLEQILDYLYTGNIVLSDSNIDDILNIAVQLDLVRLKAQCITFLQNYNLVNMLTYTEIAIKFKLDVLHQHMIKYMQGCFSLFNSTLEYQKMSMETLCTLLGIFVFLFCFVNTQYNSF